MYYAMHHLFLSVPWKNLAYHFTCIAVVERFKLRSADAEDYGIYLACVDLSALRLSMEAEWTESSNDELEEGDKSTQTWDALEWWLASIVVHAPNSPVAIVGTHDDCFGLRHPVGPNHGKGSIRAQLGLAPSSRLSVHTEVHERIEAFCKKLPELNESAAQLGMHMGGGVDRLGLAANGHVLSL